MTTTAAPILAPTMTNPIQLAEAVRAGDRRALARAITLIESTRADHRATADALLAAQGRYAQMWRLQQNEAAQQQATGAPDALSLPA